MTTCLGRPLLFGSTCQLRPCPEDNVRPKSSAFWRRRTSILFPKMKQVTEIDLKLVQRINIFFCVKIGLTVEETFEGLTVVFDQNCLHKRTVKRWFQAFTNGRTCLVDLYRRPKRRTGRSAGNVALVGTAIQRDRSLTIEDLKRQTGLPSVTIQRILTKDLKLRRLSAKFVPAQLTPRHWRLCLEASQNMLRITHMNPGFLKRLVTMDETWVYTYDPLNKVQASQWLSSGEPHPSHPRRARAVGKCMLITFCDWRGMLHHEYVRGRTVNSDLFVRILARFQAALHRKRPRCRRYLHMDNASPHRARITQLRLLLTGQRTITHPPYSPDLSPCDFWLYPRIKKGLKGRRFPDLDSLETAVDEQIAAIPSFEYRDCFTHKWPMRWARCMYRNGNYFEGLS